MSRSLLRSAWLPLLALLGACVAPRADEKVVNVYSARHYNTDNALYEAFTRRTGIRVNKIEGKDAELIERIRSEGVTSPADVLITVDAGRLWRAEQAGLFQPVQSTVLSRDIPADLRDPQGRWFGFARRARVVVYNRAELQPSEIRTYEDLASPRLRGRLCLRSSENIYNQSLVAAQIASRGATATERWLKGLMANVSRPPQGNDTTQIKDVASGVCGVALVNHYYLARMLDSDNPDTRAIAARVGVLFPQPTHINISGAGVLTHSPHRENAIAFLEFLASPEGQQAFVRGTHEYPARGTAAADATVRAFGPFQADPVNVQSYGANNAEAVKLMTAVGWK